MRLRKRLDREWQRGNADAWHGRPPSPRQRLNETKYEAWAYEAGYDRGARCEFTDDGSGHQCVLRPGDHVHVIRGTARV